MKSNITIKTRVGLFMEGKISPCEYRELYNHYDSMNPNDRLYITTETPISHMKIEEIEEVLQRRISLRDKDEARTALRIAMARCKELGIDTED